MRLVNREFELKVSDNLFRAVVVPFHPELYGIHDSFNQLNEPTSRNDSGAVMLRDKGMRVFEGFGRYISRFALSRHIPPFLRPCADELRL